MRSKVRGVFVAGLLVASPLLVGACTPTPAAPDGPIGQAVFQWGVEVNRLILNLICPNKTFYECLGFSSSYPLGF